MEILMQFIIDRMVSKTTNWMNKIYSYIGI